MARILIVEDDHLIRDIYTRCLSEEGYQVFGAASAAEALSGSWAKPLDAILLDINLPDASDGSDDGTRLAAALQERNPGARVVVCSCHPLDVQRQLMPKASAYFDKSSGCLALLAQMRSILPAPHAE